MKNWRNKPCPFCGEPLVNQYRVVTQPGTGLAIHLDCDRTIKRLKSKEKNYLTTKDLFYKEYNYIQIYINDGSRWVYQ